MLSLPELPTPLTPIRMEEFEAATPTEHTLQAKHDEFIKEFRSLENYWRMLKSKQLDLLTLPEAIRHINKCDSRKEIEDMIPINSQLTLPVRFFPHELRKVFDSPHAPSIDKEHVGFLIVKRTKDNKTYSFNHPETSLLRYKFTSRISKGESYRHCYLSPRVLTKPILGNTTYLRGTPIEHANEKTLNGEISEQIKILGRLGLFVRLSNTASNSDLLPTASLDYMPSSLARLNRALNPILGLSVATPQQVSLLGKRVSVSHETNIKEAIASLFKLISNQQVILEQKTIKIPTLAELDTSLPKLDNLLDI